MAGDIDGDGHVQLSLGLYVLGGLDDDALITVENHLAQCAVCRAESAELSLVPEALALLSSADVDALIQEFGGPSQPTIRPDRPNPSDRRRSKGPADVRPPARAGTSRRRWRPAQVRLAVAGCVLALVVGVGTGLRLTADAGPAPLNTVLTGETTDSVSGASLGVVVTGHGTRSTVRATVSGLRPAIPYQLFAVTTDGRKLTVDQWLGTANPQPVAGDIVATVAEIAVFTVAQQDGAVIVSVRFGTARTSSGVPPGPTARATGAAPAP